MRESSIGTFSPRGRFGVPCPVAGSCSLNPILYTLLLQHSESWAPLVQGSDLKRGLVVHALLGGWVKSNPEAGNNNNLHPQGASYGNGWSGLTSRSSPWGFALPHWSVLPCVFGSVYYG